MDKIFIYDIEKKDQIVNKDNYFHIFKKEIIYNFVKDSYLEIILKVLTVVSNYVLIGYYQISCNFYNEIDELFYNISLSIAAGSINKLSTIKSVFIVPINEDMTKIKIDFFIMPIKGQENRVARFIIHDINSNKIYIKYLQKINEMSIRNIQDSLNNVNNISSNLEQIDTNKNIIASNLEKIDDLSVKLNNNIRLKNIKNILFYNEKKLIDFKNIFFNKTFEFNIKKNNFVEIDFRMLLKYESIKDSDIVTAEFRLYDNNIEQIYIATYNNGDYILHSNFVFINKNIFYNFKKDTKNLKIIIEFRMIRDKPVKIYYEPRNTDRMIIKHFGN